MRQREDLRVDLIETEIWQQGTRREALDTLYEHYVRQALAAVDWYATARRSKRRWGRGVRFVALLFAGAAAGVPFVPAMTGVALNPALAAVSLGAAAACIVMDRFFGWSSGWMRYVLTGARIREQVDAFQLAWQAAVARWPGHEPTDAELGDHLEKLRQFAERVNALVREETEAWVAEFQSAAHLAESRVRSLRVK